MRLFSFFSFLILLSSCSYLPEESLISEDLEIRENAEYIFLKSKTQEKDSSVFVFYPGALVDPHAYIESLYRIAQGGFPVIILKTDINLAVTNIKKGLRVTKDFPQVKHWIAGGHSLGGVMSCYMLKDAKDVFEGLILMAAYNDKNSDLSDWQNAAVLSVSASEDGLTLQSDIQNAKAFLPEALDIDNVADIMPGGYKGKTLYYSIAGGNHAGFGNYGNQKGDRTATISSTEQHEKLAEIVLAFLNNNGF